MRTREYQNFYETLVWYVFIFFTVRMSVNDQGYLGTLFE